MRETTCSTVITRGADTMHKSEANTIPNLHRGNASPNSSREANALMSKDLVGLPKVLVCSAEARSYGLNEDFIVLKGSGSFIGDNLALGRATENVVCDAHIEVVFEKCSV